MLTLLLLGSCKSDKRYHDRLENTPDTSTGEGAELQSAAQFQRDLDRFYRTGVNSPLTAKQKRDFRGLAFYPIDERWVVRARVEPVNGGLPIMLPSNRPSDSDTMQEGGLQLPYLRLTFEREGKQHRLTVYQLLDSQGIPKSDEPLFLPFADQTNGKGTYEGGRYLNIPYPDRESVTLLLDFNQAYHPYCAYNEEYICPLVPAENVLDLKVEAGIRL